MKIELDINSIGEFSKHLVKNKGFTLNYQEYSLLKEFIEFTNRNNIQKKKRKSKPRPDKYNPRDIAILGGDPSL